MLFYISITILRFGIKNISTTKLNIQQGRAGLKKQLKVVIGVDGVYIFWKFNSKLRLMLKFTYACA